ncbi:TPA: hypothetical protein ACH3X1_003489 [Trebouxia sp. C0004]
MNANVIPQALHQALWLTVGTVERTAQGHTQLNLRCPGSAHSIGLFAHDLVITGVKIDGEDVEFEQRLSVYKHPDPTEGKQLTAQGAADLAEHSFYEYQRLVQKEAEPELIIQLPNRGDETDGAEAKAPEFESEDAKVQRDIDLVVTVAFAIEQPNCGLHFHGLYACTDNQLRRSRAWFPCVDVPLAACPFELHFTVPASHMAVSCGQLLKQAWSDNGKSRSFHYKLSIATPPQDIALAVGPFTAWQVALPTKAIHVKAADNNASVAAAAAAGSAAAGGSGHLGAPPTPLQTPPYSALRTPRTPVLLDAFGRGDSTITHFAPPETKLAADHTLKTLGLAFNMYETFLGCKFPYKALQTVVLPEGMAAEGMHSAAGLQILAGEMMVHERTVEQGIESRLAIAYAVAQQWFGVLMRPRTPADAWLVEGLAGYLHDLFLRRFLGKNELRYRRHKQRQAIYMADDGQAPPLYCKASPALQWGSMYGTEHLDPSGLRKWKATAVMWMLSAKVSEDIFKKQLERLAGAVANHLQQLQQGLGMNAGVDSEHDPRLLSSREFLRELGKGAGARKELSALSLRWINLRGLPHITAAFTYNKKRNSIELAVRQQGSEAAKRSTEQAAEQAAKEGSAVGLLRVLLKEHDHDNVQMVQLAAKPLLLQDLKVNTKPGARRGKKAGKKKKDEAAEAEDLDDDEQTQHEQEIEDAAAADRPPVQWVEMDPQMETLASTCLLQPDWMWAGQLERSKDTAAQSVAVAGLAALRPTTHTAVSALEHCLQNDQVYPRIRCEAAMALGTTASSDTEFAGLHALLKIFRARCHSSSASEQAHQIEQAQAGSNIGEFLVNETLPLAIACVRDEKGFSTPEAVEVLVDVLKHTDNRGSFYDNSSMLAAALEALGHLRLPDIKGLQPVVKQLDRFLAREKVLPSYHAVVAQAALRAFVELALSMRPAATSLISRVSGVCVEHSQAQWHPDLRRTAYDCLMRMAAAVAGLNATINLALDAIKLETSPLVRLGIMEDLQPITLQALRSPSLASPADPHSPPFQTQQHAQHAQHGTVPSTAERQDMAAGQVEQDTLLRLHSVFSQQHSVKLRHLAFMLLSRLGGLPPTLYRPLEEPEVVGPQEPASSLQTHAIGGGPAVSAKSGGRQGALSGPHGAVSGPHRMLSAEPSMRDLEEVTGKEIQSPFRVEATIEPRAPSSYPAEPHRPPGTAHPAAQPQQEGAPQRTQGQPAGPSRKRIKSASPAPALAASQEPGGPSGPAPVTAEELEAIMKGGGADQQPRPRRKKQKTDSAAAPSSQERSMSPAPINAAATAHHQQQQQQMRDQLTGPRHFAAPPNRDSSSAALARPHVQAGRGKQLEPEQQLDANRARVNTGTTGQQSARGESAASAAAASHQTGGTFVMPPPRVSGAAPAGQARLQQPQAAGQFGAARPAESYGGSVASDSAWGTEEERLERKRLKQEEKQRLKEMETSEEKAARRQAKRDKKARKSGRADTYSMADSAGGRTMDVSDITS